MAAMALMVMLSASVADMNAQARHNNLSPERVAEIRSERMARELRLNPVQYAKLYHLNLREARRMSRNRLCFFDCADYRCDLLRIIGEVNFRIYESIVRNHRSPHRGHGHHHAAVPAPRPPHGHAVHVAPHVKPHIEAHVAPHARPAGKHDKGGGKQSRPQYRVK